MAEVMGEFRHLRLEGVADQQGGRPAEKDHRQDRRIGCGLAHELDGAAEA